MSWGGLISADLDDAEKVEAHWALLSSYYKQRQGNGWATVKDDGYLYKHLVYHLRG